MRMTLVENNNRQDNPVCLSQRPRLKRPSTTFIKRKTLGPLNNGAGVPGKGLIHILITSFSEKFGRFQLHFLFKLGSFSDLSFSLDSIVFILLCLPPNPQHLQIPQ
jgi:hypothetical protein